MPSDYYNLDNLHPYDLYGILKVEDILTGYAIDYPLEAYKMPFATINMGKGDNRTLRIYIKDSDLNAIDITGATAVLTVKTSLRDGTTLFTRSTANAGEGTIGSADEGELFFYLVPANTSSLDYSQVAFFVRITLSNAKTYSVLSGVINLEE